MKYKYQSNFKEYIIGLLEQKHSLGFPYRVSEEILYRFDRLCFEHFPHENQLTKEIGLSFAVINPTEKASSFQNRLAPIRELAKYMNRLGINAYVIPTEISPKEKQRAVPHVFTDRELKLFFSASDKLVWNERCRMRHLAVPVIFRLMYCCGLRPTEVRVLKTENIDFSSGILKIEESKGHKDRMVVMSDDVLVLCRKYYALVQNDDLQSDYFFPAQIEHGNCYTGNWLRKMFKLCWDESGIDNYCGNSPRPYDFRHTFATKKLYEWMKAGKDLETMLPYLSAYMGHTKFSHTAYYIHLVPEIFPYMSQIDLGTFEGLIPEVEYDF